MSTPDDPFVKRPATTEPGGLPSYGSAPVYGSGAPGQGQYGGTPQAGPGYGTPSYDTPGNGAPAYDAPAFGAPAAGGFGPGTGRPPLASWGVRVVGAIIDGLISGVVQFVVGLVSSGLGNLVALLVFLYFGYLTGTTGQTPGRKVMGVRILREADGQPLGAGVGIGRGFLHLLDLIPLFLGYLWPLWDAKKQTFADKIVGSVAVRG